ncbi:hypothetical protein BX286_4488 [Streptomyces sp. 3211.6]|uniref:hypothetical protein n=1 Tax=Streptomyces TaxID=1883 RepID=UPI0009A4FE4D|nr:MULTISPECIES: hypothetical protein [Streptomyces]RKT06446.1 hypothetical protein BX286_4488 [Streptomyces sp. 3211.6]RPF46020.1 hypothetical protein EDD96_2587 [Streptomyces sp. Ag109_G2-6]
MTDHLIPPQSGGSTPVDPRNGRPPVHPSTSEAGRLLCAGTYLDGTFRDRVIDELYVHEERIAAPSYGFDATRVLAHALRARRVELAWSAGIIGAWLVGIPLTSGLISLLLGPFLLLGFANWLRDRPDPWMRFLSVFPRVLGWLVLLGTLFLFWMAWTDGGELGRSLRYAFGGWMQEGGSGGGTGFGGSGGAGGFDDFGGSGGLGAGRGSSGVGDSSPLFLWLTLLVFAGIATLIALRRVYVSRIISRELDQRAYAGRTGDPVTQNPRFGRVRDRILDEQHAPLIMYNTTSPFLGAGEGYRAWQLSVELRPREDLGAGREPQPVTNAEIVRRIVPLLHALRVPSLHGSLQAQADVRDRLRELVVDECVFLPVAGLPHRDRARSAREQYPGHRQGSVEEGGELRRHFLRIRVGGWDENLVVSVFVRVHTQGGMMMLEVAPHVLLPVRTLFQNADADARRYLSKAWYGKAIEALAETPGSFWRSSSSLLRALVTWWQVVTGRHDGLLPEGPRLSAREIGADEDGSLFQLMDLDRYLKTIQDRVVHGVTVALHEAGWHTEEFAQRAVHVAEGATFIQSVSNSAFSVGGTGHHNTAGSGTSGKGSSGGK